MHDQEETCSPLRNHETYSSVPVPWHDWVPICEVQPCFRGEQVRSMMRAAATATAPVKKQLIFREGGGWFDFLILKRTVVSKKNVSGFEGTLHFLTQIS